MRRRKKPRNLGVWEWIVIPQKGIGVMVRHRPSVNWKRESLLVRDVPYKEGPDLHLLWECSLCIAVLSEASLLPSSLTAFSAFTNNL